ncbi:peptidase, M23/M37 family protein [Pseudooceanicola batsensis HTCC2597]|uniref:Peptidase, M23/M37 family protein n=1 Tax=Pseudooceanicola batsensis (strain ATCC BAA-863 / DSM 15984 / KCTC 12145 / HTCC2597) TaxID=252305 RepID=A3TUW3_PSEBH|nr:M23 family metallopeptidase [Pseudooceanicola batsensis]EAQ04309.1 peptidase, M23/M37 family protein [Pseudooceanicola batsensis HTCC2597]
MPELFKGAGIIPALFLCLPAGAEPRLAMPVDCTLGETCFIQNYMDRDPGPGARDFTCAGLSYDTHKGTDFGLPSLRAMTAGVDVHAAAPGVVRGVRDGMIDRVYTPQDEARIDGRDCGNGVVIQHGDGWETQYCHLMNGTVRVRSGQLVETGDVLGRIGLSGRTQFPHLHISVRHDGEPVDPFTPDGDPAACRTGEARTMWIDDITYQPGAIMAAGFATGVPDYETVKAGAAAVERLARDADALVLWGYAFGGRTGDVMTLRIEGPEGTFFETEQTLEKDQAQFYRAGGKRLRSPLSPGRYSGHIALIRDGTPVSEEVATLIVE